MILGKMCFVMIGGFPKNCAFPSSETFMDENFSQTNTAYDKYILRLKVFYECSLTLLTITLWINIMLFSFLLVKFIHSFNYNFLSTEYKIHVGYITETRHIPTLMEFVL